MLRTATAVLAVMGLMSGVGPRAWAQTMSLGNALNYLEGDSATGNLVLFTTFDYGTTNVKAKFDGEVKAEQIAAGVSQDANSSFKLEERNQQLNRFGPQFGARWTMIDRLTLKGAVGVSWLKLVEQRDPPIASSNFTGDAEVSTLFDEMKVYRIKPGFSATLGADFLAFSLQRLGVKAGLQLSYLSTSGMKGHTLEGKNTDFAGNTVSYEEVRTTDISMHLFTIQPHVGVEWRPFQSFIVNSFGMFGAMMLSTGKVKRVTLDGEDIAGANTETSTTSEVGAGLSMPNFLGAYYGWYVGIPHFGNLGLELQFCSGLTGSLSYQYQF